MTTIRIEWLDELIRRIDDISKLNKVKAAIHQGAIALEKQMRLSYPRQSHRPNPLLRGNSAKAQRMRAGFFARLNANPPEIVVPYRRGQPPQSEDLQNSWTTQSSLDGFRAWVGTGVSYARMVQDSAKQTSYHKQTGWPTTDDIVAKHGQRVISDIEQALQREVNNG